MELCGTLLVTGCQPDRNYSSLLLLPFNTCLFVGWLLAVLAWLPISAIILWIYRLSKMNMNILLK